MIQFLFYYKTIVNYACTLGWCDNDKKLDCTSVQLNSGVNAYLKTVCEKYGFYTKAALGMAFAYFQPAFWN